MRVAVLGVLLAAASVVCAQPPAGTLEGLVIDSVSLQPIRGATLSLEGTRLGAVSRDSGQWIIRDVPAGTYMLRVRATGYRARRESVRVRPGLKESYFFSLTPSMREGGEVARQEDVVITAGKHVQAIQEVPVSMEIVDGHVAAARGAIQLDQVLRYVPGVNINDDQVNVRGSSGYSRGLGSRVMFLVDGVPMLSGDTGELKLDVFPRPVIDRVEVVKGAGSALYGSSALGGVINIVTRKPTDSLSLYANLSGGAWPAPSYADWRWYSGTRTQAGIEAAMSNTFGPVGVIASGNVRRDDSYRQNDDHRRWGFYTKLTHDFSPSLGAWLAVNAANDDHGNWIYWRDEAHALLTADSTTAYQRIYSFKMHLSGVVRYAPSDDMVGWFRAGLYRTNVDDNINPTGPDSASKLVSHANAFSLEAQITHQLSARTFVTYGAQATGNVISSNYYGNRSQWDGAVYAQVEQHLSDRALFTLGARTTTARTENLAADTRFDPKAGVSYRIDDELSLRASAGTGFRAPSLAERFVATRTGTLVTYPNPALQFERNVSYEIGGAKSWGSYATLDVALFSSDYWNLIEPDFVCTLPAQIRFVNVTHARMQGADIAATLRPIEHGLSVSLGYTYNWARSVDENAPLKYRPRHLFMAGLNAAWGALSAGADVRFASRVERIDDTVATCINVLTGYSVIPDFDKRVQTFVTDARIAIDLREPLRLPLIFTLNGYNLFQYYYVEIPANIAPIRNFVAQVEWVL